MLLKHSLIYFISRVVTGATALVGIWLFSRLFAPDVYGHYMGMVAGATVINLGLFQWLRITFMRLLPAHENPAQLGSVLLGLFGVQAAITLALVAAAFALKSDWQLLVQGTLLLALGYAGSDLSLDKLRSRLQPWQYLAFSVLRDVLQILFVLLFLHYGMQGNALLLATITGYALPVVLWAPALWRGIKPSLLAPVRAAMCRYGLPLIGNYCLTAFMNNADRLLLAPLAGTHAMGVYSAASGIARQSITLLMQSVNLAAAPLAFRAGRTDGAPSAKDQLGQNLVLLMALGLPATVGLALVARPLCDLALGPAYAEGAAQLLPLVAIGALLYGLRTFYADHAYHMAEQTRLLFRNASLCALISIPVYVLLILKFGAVGAGLGAMANGAIGLFTSWIMGRKVFALPVPARPLGWVLLATIIMGLLCWQGLTLGGGLLGLLVTIAISGVAYVAVLLAGDVLMLRSLILKKLSRR